MSNNLYGSCQKIYMNHVKFYIDHGKNLYGSCQILYESYTKFYMNHVKFIWFMSNLYHTKSQNNSLNS